MADSAFRRLPFFPILLSALFLVFFSSNGFSQGKQQIEILGANALKMDTVHNARKLVGNVKLRQDEVTMECDSALFYNTSNAVDAFGHVFIYDNLTKVRADSLKYDGNNKIAVLTGNVRVIQDSATLETSRLIYNSQLKYAAYYNGGKILSRDMTVTSRKGYYFTIIKKVHFKGDVEVKSKEYNLLADTMQYDMEKEISYFIGPTVITMRNEVIHCESGWYDSKTDISSFGKNTRLQSEAQKIQTDSLYYNNNTGLGNCYKYFRWTDTTMNAILIGKRAVFLREQARVTATDSALLIYLVDNDSLFLSADTLKSRKDTIADFTEFFAFHKVKIFKSNLQGVCDSLSFSFKDSTIRMYYEPILWSEENQLTGDSISMLLVNEKIDRVELYPNGFIINKAHEELFNQIKGRHIFGYFKEGSLNKMLVEGNGESIYYGTDDKNAFIGANRAICSNMWIYMKDAQVNRIAFLAKPDATFFPIQTINPSEFRLKGFLWKEEFRPASKAALFSKE